MIYNMDAVSFQHYGTIISDWAAQQDGSDLPETRRNLTNNAHTIYKTTSETRIACVQGRSVLSVSLDGQQFEFFYLDKAVQLKPDIYFGLGAFVGEALAALRYETAPAQWGSHPRHSYRENCLMKVGYIYSFFYQERDAGFLFPGEAHPMVELTYVDKGELHSVVGGKDILLRQGDVAVYGPDQWHMQYADVGVAPRYVTTIFELDGVDLTPLLNRRIEASQGTVRIIQEMLREADNPDIYSADVIKAYLHRLMVQLMREGDQHRTGKIQPSNTVHNENAIISKAQQYISAHIREKLSVPMVARQVDVSPSYLTSLFHKNLQISPGEYIRRTKLQESKQLIRENNLNFTEIAEALQYSTVHHFSRQFKEKFGITPTEYAKSVR